MAEGKRVLIVGGVAGGASAATRARRLSEAAEIVMFERDDHVSFANCGLPYHIAGTIADRKRLLLQTPAGLQRRYRIDVRVRSEVTAINPTTQEIAVRDHRTGKEYWEAYDALILSPGAEPVWPPIPGVDDPRVLALRNMAHMDRINALLDERKPERAVIVGGGYIGLEMAEALRERGLDVTLVELTDQVMGPADPEMASMLHQELTLNGVDLRLGTAVTEFGDSDGDLEVRLSTGETLTCGLAILAVGVRPEVTLAREAGLEIGELGGIAVDDHMRTSVPTIYAVGDAVEVRELVSGKPALIPLAGPASRQGRIAADNVFGRDSTYGKTQGTAVCKVFNLTIGMTGLSEKALERAGIPHEKIYVHPSSHVGYFPGASAIALKLLFDPQDGRILGAQAVGAAGVDKRIDVLATALRAGMTVFDLEHVELSYAPPYGSAKDVINYAGFVAANVLRGDVRLCHVDDVTEPKEHQVVVDVRTSAEVEGGTIPGAIHLPLDELRDRLHELPKDKELLVICHEGFRGYLACRTLSQHGFDCRNLTGGYKTYLMSTRRPPVPPAPGSKVGADERESGETADSKERDVSKVVKSIDACGLQCPGPIQRLRAEIDAVDVGDYVSIVATDPAFPADVSAWCHTTGHELVEVTPEDSRYRAVIAKRAEVGDASRTGPAAGTKQMTIVVFSSDFDRVMAAFIIANGAAAMGFKPTLFFTFWGLNVLRRDGAVKVKKTLIERMFGRMMPRGPEKLALSRMHMAGMGLKMIKGIMRKKNVASLPNLIDSAREAGVTLIACAMSMDLMGIKRDELIDGVEEGGVAMYLDRAGAGTVNLFV